MFGSVHANHVDQSSLEVYNIIFTSYRCGIYNIYIYLYVVYIYNIHPCKRGQLVSTGMYMAKKN